MKGGFGSGSTKSCLIRPNAHEAEEKNPRDQLDEGTEYLGRDSLIRVTEISDDGIKRHEHLQGQWIRISG